MTRSGLTQLRARRVRVRRMRAAGVLVAVAVLGVVLGSKAMESPSTRTMLTTIASHRNAPARTEHRPARRGSLGVADGAVPDGTTIADAIPGVTKLDPALLDALRRAAADAGNDGVAFIVDSGWRSSAYQEHLLEDAVAQYGSAAEAARWVATPGRSEHVKGNAIDLGRDAAAWLSQHGAAYGLCQVYDNEPWHFELRPAAAGAGCPARYADPTQDPRMR